MEPDSSQSSLSLLLIIRILRLEDGDDSAKTSLKKWILFVHCDYSNSNVGELSWGLIHKNHTQGHKKNNFDVACLRPPENLKLEIFMSLSCSDGKKMYKKSDARVDILFCLLDLLLFTFSLTSPSPHLKVLIKERSVVKGSARNDKKKEWGKTLPFLLLPITPRALFDQACRVTFSACDPNRDDWGPGRYRAASSTGELFLSLPRFPVSSRRACSQDK